MFAKTIIDSDAFLDMPLSTQALYFHLSMRADDDGFVNNPKKVTRMINCGEDDFKLLIAKRFLLLFESGVVVIKHWLIHNTIRKDRKTPTNYQYEFSQLVEKENNSYTKVDNTKVPERLDVTPEMVVKQVTTNWQPDDNQATADCQRSVVESSVLKGSVIESSTVQKAVSDDEVRDNFRKLWELYPKKTNQLESFEFYKLAIKKEATNKEIQTGIVNYLKYLKMNKTELRYVKTDVNFFKDKFWQNHQSEPVAKYGQKAEVIPDWMKEQDLEQSEKTTAAPEQSTDTTTESDAIREKMKALGLLGDDDN